MKLDQALRNLESVAEHWTETKTLAEAISVQISSVDREWTEKVKIQAEAYLWELSNRELLFRVLPLWSFVEEHAFDGDDRRYKIQAMNDMIIKEHTALGEVSFLCSIFDLNEFLSPCKLIVGELKLESDELMNLWRI
jgi:hypothetical protein